MFLSKKIGLRLEFFCFRIGKIQLGAKRRRKFFGDLKNRLIGRRVANTRGLLDYDLFRKSVFGFPKGVYSGGEGGRLFVQP
jgi:hypothetical protein